MVKKIDNYLILYTMHIRSFALEWKSYRIVLNFIIFNTEENLKKNTPYIAATPVKSRNSVSKDI